MLKLQICNSWTLVLKNLLFYGIIIFSKMSPSVAKWLRHWVVVPAFAGSIPVVRPKYIYSVSKNTFKYFAKVIASSSILFNATGSSIPVNGISRVSFKQSKKLTFRVYAIFDSHFN